MVDLSQTDALDNWFFHSNEPVISHINQSPSSFSHTPSPSTSSSELSLPVTKVFSTVSNDEEKVHIKKRKHEQNTDTTEKKKSKQTPAFMRRNIRHLFTSDKLQDDTLTALKAEQDRLKRLEEINDNYPQFNAIYSQLTANNSNQSEDDECIVLEDDENEEEQEENSTRLNMTSSRMK